MKGKIAIVTGASSGIGLAVAKKLVKRGARVALVARTAKTLDAAVKELGAENATAFPLDVGNLDALEALPQTVVDRMGGLDILVNNAGLNHRGPIAKHTARELQEVIHVNLSAPIVLTRASQPHLRRGGSVIFVASLAGMVPVPGEAAYSASKAGMRAFARAASEEFEEKNVHVACVCPGPVDTGFFGEIADLEDVADLVFSQPISTAEQIADAVITCIEDRVDEIAVPGPSGKLATVAYVFPGIAKRVRPMLERRGQKAKRAYIEKKKAE